MNDRPAPIPHIHGFTRLGRKAHRIYIDATLKVPFTMCGDQRAYDVQEGGPPYNKDGRLLTLHDGIRWCQHCNPWKVDVG